MNELDVCGADIIYAYLQVSSSEKHYIVCRPEFGLKNEGKRTIIRRALNDVKSAEADYWRHVRATMDDMGFTSCKDGSEVWMRTGVKATGEEY